MVDADCAGGGVVAGLRTVTGHLSPASLIHPNHIAQRRPNFLVQDNIRVAI